MKGIQNDEKTAADIKSRVALSSTLFWRYEEERQVLSATAYDVTTTTTNHIATTCQCSLRKMSLLRP
ncbi:hypothetical protein CRUP_005174 [Coryphaenoides rupestris]|nr:hypothetical protein CRUP_005174 [Coryphaenoides rupestris]